MGGNYYPFTYTSSTWFKVEHYINIDLNLATFTIDAMVVHTWPFSYVSGSTVGTNQLGGVDFYNIDPTYGYYIDDISFDFNDGTADCCPDFVLKDAVEICYPEISCYGSFSAEDFLAACKNSLHTYTVYPNDPGFTYTWTVTGGTIASFTGNPKDILWDDVATGYIKVVINSNIPGINCNDSIMMEICLIDRPEAAFTLDPDTVCVNTPVNFTNTSTSGCECVWDMGDGTTYTTNDPLSHSYILPGTYTVTLTATDMGQGLWTIDSTTVPCGCSDTATGVVVVLPGIGPTIDTECCYGTVCPGETSSFCTPMVCTSFNWSVTGGNIISGDGTSCIQVKWYNTYIFPTTVTLQRCASSGCPGSTTLYVPVLYPNLPIDGPNTLCLGASGSFSLPTLPGTFYNWTVTGGYYDYDFNLQDRNVPTVNISFNNPGTYVVKCEYDNPLAGCDGVSTIQVAVLPQFFISGNEKVCEGDPTLFSTAGFLTTGPSANWIFSPSGPTISGDGTPFVVINWPPGNYVLTAISIPPYDDFCNLTATKNIEVVAKPILGNITGADSVCTGDNYTYSITSNTSGSPFVWSVNPGIGTLMSQMGDDNDSVVIRFSDPGPWTIRVYQEIEITLGNFCQSLEDTLVVYPFLPPDISGIRTVCVDDTLHYQAGGSIIPGDYLWSIDPSQQGTILSGQGSRRASTVARHCNNSCCSG